MNKSEFQSLMAALTTRINLCWQQLGDLHTTEDISRISLARAADLKNFCVAEEEVMTKIAMVDLYHIIGMGKLTPIQMMKFTYAMQDYLQYRSTIKAVVKHLTSITDLPKLPVEARYKLQGLGDLVLYSGSREGEFEEASIDDYNILKSTKAGSLPFKLEGNKITVDITQFTYFTKILATVFNCSVSIENFKNKLALHGDYMGIEWLESTPTKAVGYFKYPDVRARLALYYEQQTN
jgi:hypothetical protein